MSLCGICHTVPWGQGGGSRHVCLSTLHTVFLPLLWPRESTDMLHKVELGPWDSGGSCAWNPSEQEYQGWMQKPVLPYKATVLNLKVTIPSGFYQMSCMPDIYITILKSGKITVIK